MPIHEQLLNFNINHLSSWYGSHTPPATHLGPGQRPDSNGTRTITAADGQHQELRRISRDSAHGSTSLYTLLWYVPLTIYNPWNAR